MSKSKNKRKEKKPHKSPNTRLWQIEIVRDEQKPTPEKVLQNDGKPVVQVPQYYITVTRASEDWQHIYFGHPAQKRMVFRTKTPQAAVRKFIRNNLIGTVLDHERLSKKSIKRMFQYSHSGPYGLRVEFT